MNMPAALRRIWIQLTADRRRFGVLCATFGVGLLLWARLVIVSHVPRTAVAEPPATPAGATDAGASGKNKTGTGGKSSKGAADKATTKDGVKVDNKPRTTLDVQFSARCERDPFVISPVHFPRAMRVPEVKQEAGKLPTEPAEDASLKEARFVARLRDLLGTVKLEAAMGTSMAVIDGQRYRVGERLPPLGKERAQFTLTEIRQRSVMLECQGRLFELEMPLPVK